MSATIDNAPITVEEMVEWMDRMTHHEFSRVWVSLVIEQLAEHSIRDANTLLCYARNRYRVFDLRGRRMEILVFQIHEDLRCQALDSVKPAS